MRAGRACWPARPECAGPGRVFFTNSGTEANEAAFKITRRTGRTHLVAAEGGFHGRTMGALALTHKAAYREPFEPLPGDVVPCRTATPTPWPRRWTHDVAAVFLEPIQGEAGVSSQPPSGYLAAAREITTAHGALLVARRGADRHGPDRSLAGPPSCRHSRRAADIVTLAKGLGGGFPIGALIALGPGNAGLLAPGHHGTTFGGNPVAAAAALAVPQTYRARRSARRTTTSTATGLAGRRSPISAIRWSTASAGTGLLLGIVLTDNLSAETATAAMEAGFIINAPAPGRDPAGAPADPDHRPGRLVRRGATGCSKCRGRSHGRSMVMTSTHWKRSGTTSGTTTSHPKS